MIDKSISTAAEAHEASAIPRRHDVHSKSDQPSGDAKLPEGVLKKPVERKSSAEWAYERLIMYIKNFEEQLDNDEEVAMGFTGGTAGVLRIEGMGFFDPDIVTFYGTDPAGARTQAIQHVSQLNVILRALPKEVEDDAPNRIGFRLAEELEQKDDEDAET